MRYDWMDEYLMAKPGVEMDFKEEWNWKRYMINGKMFAALCFDDNNNWNSVKVEGVVPDDLLKDMLDKSYQLILSAFSKKKQAGILGL